MSSAMYSLKWNKSTLTRLKGDVMARMLNLGFKTATEAQHGAPVLTGALISSIRATTDGKNTVYVLAGGSFQGKDIPYARRQEYENKRHPYYMKNAFGWLENNYLKEFKGLTK